MEALKYEYSGSGLFYLMSSLDYTAAERVSSLIFFMRSLRCVATLTTIDIRLIPIETTNSFSYSAEAYIDDPV